MKFKFEDFVWQSDYNGDEVGYDDILVVGLYNLINTNLYVYINTETNEVLEYWLIGFDV